MSRTAFQWRLLLALLIISITFAWAFAADTPIPLFQSPPPPLTPGWEQIQVTPTPRPQPVLAITPGTPVLESGMRGYWQLEETHTGDRADSSSLGSNTLTNINGVSWTTNGQIGNASDFESANSQYLKIESYQAVDLNFYRSFTLVGWIKRESIGNDMVLTAKYSYGTGIDDRAYRFQLTTENKLRLIVSPDGLYSSDYSVTGGTVLTSTTNWYHVAAVFDANAKRLKLYVDGNLDADKSVTYDTVFQSTAPFMLGANMLETTTDMFFDGLVDEWWVYKRALSQNDIQDLMNQ